MDVSDYQDSISMGPDLMVGIFHDATRTLVRFQNAAGVIIDLVPPGGDLRAFIGALRNCQHFMGNAATHFTIPDSAPLNPSVKSIFGPED